MNFAIRILEAEQKKLETSLKRDNLMQENRQSATLVMTNIAQIKQAIKFLKAKQLAQVRNANQL